MAEQIRKVERMRRAEPRATIATSGRRIDSALSTAGRKEPPMAASKAIL